MNMQELALRVLTEWLRLSSSSSLIALDNKEGHHQSWGPTAAEQRETAETGQRNALPRQPGGLARIRRGAQGKLELQLLECGQSTW